MKLEDLDRIRELAETLDFNSTLLKRLSVTQPRLVIGQGRDSIEIWMPPTGYRPGGDGPQDYGHDPDRAAGPGASSGNQGSGNTSRDFDDDIPF